VASAIDRLREAARRVPSWGWALAFSVVLCLPRLARFGFWDPWELRLAEQARDVAASGHLFDATADGRYPGVRPLGTILSAIGIALFGPSEVGARVFIALTAVGALMAVYWAGVGLLRPRAALLATLALGTMPLFVLEARQLTSDAPLIAALALALGGLGRFAWPPDGKRRWRDLGIAALALGIGTFAGGALLGFVLPALSLVAALIVGWGLVPVEATGPNAPDDGTGPLTAPGVGPDLPAGRSLGGSSLQPAARGFPAFALLGVAGLALLPPALIHLVSGKYSFLLGGIPRASTTHTFDALVRELGFGLFPWSAVALFALARPLIRLDGASEAPGSRSNPRLAFVGLYLLVFASFGFALSSTLNIVTGEARYVALAAVALALGAFLDEALEGLRPEPVTGLLMAIGTMIIARDFYLAPEELASVHINEKVHWPAAVVVGDLFLAVGLVAALGIYAGLAARARAVGNVPPPDLTKAGPIRRTFDRLALDAGRFGLQVGVAVAVLFSFYLAESLVPRLSTHLSFKPVLESYTKFAHAGEKIGKFRVEGHGSSFYSKQTMVELPSQERVVQFLRDPERVFAMVAADELAALDAAFKQASVPYYVVDASSSRFLLLTNRLDPGQNDENPLKKNVWMSPVAASAAPGASGEAPSEKPPWSWRVPVTATFGDSIELIGADFPPTVRRPGKIPLDLYFHVKARPPGSYKLFVHFDGPAAPRVIGDHDPLNHTFGTSYWLPGEYIRDHYETDVPLMTTPAGSYTIYFGFWPGGEGKRLKVMAGPNDGVDRVRLGTIEIK
jgi:hypothetical protein